MGTLLLTARRGARRAEEAGRMLSEREVTAAVGARAYGAGGDALGTVEHFFVDDRTGAPTWVALMTGLFGTRQSIVPAADATFSDDGLRLPVTKEAVSSAPHIAGDHLDPAEEEALRRHYATAGQGGRAEHAPAPRDEDAGSMTRSEQQLRVGTEQVATTRARLVKYVVTENVTITVPIRREEIRVEQVPIDAPDDDGVQETLLPAGGGEATAVSPSGGLPEEIVLHTERPVVSVEVVPLERVRLRTEVVQGVETVTEQVQREQIAVDQHAAPRSGV
jgi:stress response protein YsnF